MRNTERVNRIGLQMADLKARACYPDTTFMDEGGLSYTAGQAGGFTFRHPPGAASEEWKQPQCFLGATAEFSGSLSALGGWFIVHYRDGRVLVYDRDLNCHEVVYFHFMGMKAPRFWRDWKNCDLARFSVTPYGPVPGLIDPAQLSSLAFQWHCLRAHLPGFVYRIARNAVPESAVRGLKAMRGRLRRRQLS